MINQLKLLLKDTWNKRVTSVWTLKPGEKFSTEDLYVLDGVSGSSLLFFDVDLVVFRFSPCYYVYATNDYIYLWTLKYTSQNSFDICSCIMIQNSRIEYLKNKIPLLDYGCFKLTVEEELNITNLINAYVFS